MLRAARRAAHHTRPGLAMSSAAKVATLQRMTAQALAEKILAEDPTLAVVDVRDDDHVGGHIRGSTHAPSQQLDAVLLTLVRKLQDKQTVVFHCALSQQRGPSAALRYLRDRDGVLATLGIDSAARQAVYVLDRGFTGWQAVYGDDERLTEAYVKDMWRD